MQRYVSIFISIIVLLFVIAGCDSFSLPDQFSKGLILVLEKDSVKPGEQSKLYPAGGIEPYSYSVIADNLYDGGHATDPGTITEQMYTAGNSIGTVKIRLTDDMDNSFEVRMTVLPWQPQNFSADGTVPDNQTVKLDWTYDAPGYIGGFRIMRSSAGGAFVKIADLGSGIRTYTDDNAHPNDNIYHLYAVAGEFLSSYAEVSAAGQP
jgi:hypothetical protein